MSATVHVLNGPNLNLLGQREPEIYGADTLADVEAACRAVEGLDIVFRQSNAEHDLVDWIQEARGRAAAIVINPAAFRAPAVGLRDQLPAFRGPVLEVHLSRVHARGPFRQHSYVSGVVSGVIAGCGTQGYVLALLRVRRLLGADPGG